MSMLEYVPWWMGAVGLAVMTLGFHLVLKRPLGVSGSWARIVMWRNDRVVAQAEAPFRHNPQLLKDALMAATIQEFGAAAVEAALASRKGRTAQPTIAMPQGVMPVRTPWTAHFTFLVMVVVGALLTAWLKGNLQLTWDLGKTHVALFGAGFGGWMTLFFGGILVGFGTQLGGGCTSGHGLSGCSRLVGSSLVATATFFGTAVAVSFLLELAKGMV